MPKAKRSKVWLHFTSKDADSAACNKCSKAILCKGGNTSNLIKHLTTHGIFLKAEQCTVFDSLRDPTPSTSSAAIGVSSIPGEESPTPSPASVVDATDDSSRSSSVTPFTLAKKAQLTKEKVEEIHRAVTKFVVQGLHPFSTVESPSFREMTTALNPRYQPPSRDDISNTFIPAWYSVEKSNVIQKLAQVNKVAITCDGWTSVAQDHFLTVTVHYISKGKMEQNVLSTEAVYESQTGPVVAKEIASVVEQFHLEEKIIAATVDNASNMDVALRSLDFLKVGCFALTLNLAAQIFTTFLQFPTGVPKSVQLWYGSSVHH
ncbi:E3 SUMO-protein ligase ZBED1-like isoform X1 [Epinephelus lanceolatus]